MSCKSALCLRCAKVYVDNWGSHVSQMLHGCGGGAWMTSSAGSVAVPWQGGYIVVRQTHGRNGRYNPHLHIIATSGGWDPQAPQWIHLDYVPYALLRKKWQWHLLTMLRQTVKTPESRRLVDTCYTRYREGFVTDVQKGDVPMR